MRTGIWVSDDYGTKQSFFGNTQDTRASLDFSLICFYSLATSDSRRCLLQACNANEFFVRKSVARARRKAANRVTFGSHHRFAKAKTRIRFATAAAKTCSKVYERND